MATLHYMTRQTPHVSLDDADSLLTIWRVTGTDDYTLAPYQRLAIRAGLVSAGNANARGGADTSTSSRSGTPVSVKSSNSGQLPIQGRAGKNVSFAA